MEFKVTENKPAVVGFPSTGTIPHALKPPM